MRIWLAVCLHTVNICWRSERLLFANMGVWHYCWWFSLCKINVKCYKQIFEKGQYKSSSSSSLLLFMTSYIPFLLLWLYVLSIHSKLHSSYHRCLKWRQHLSKMIYLWRSISLKIVLCFVCDCIRFKRYMSTTAS